MKKEIRRLHTEDYSLIAAMDTGINEDYVIQAFHHLMAGGDQLYGLFADGLLVSFGGYTVYADSYAMLGRLRSDRRFRGQELATELMRYIIEEAFQNESIKWVGANTQEENIPARRVLEKLGLPPLTMLHGAVTKNVEMLKSGTQTWKLVNDFAQKKEWLDKMFIQPEALFPYECYYPLPATKHLFKNDEINDWKFYENNAQTRCLITKPDRKGHQYLHVVYPWNDFMQQEGLWETVFKDYQNLLSQTYNEEYDTYIWMDMTKEEVSLLPENHAFELPSPWILHGIHRNEWLKA